MKVVYMKFDFLHHIHSRGGGLVTVEYKAGFTYQRVPEAAVKKIVAAGAGVVEDERS